MNPGIDAIARLIIEELPGLAGAMQPLSGTPQSLNDLARRQHSQNLANAMLAAASGLLMPSPNRYPLGPLQRLGAGLGAALQTYNEGAAQGRVLETLGMDSGGPSRTGVGLGSVASAPPVRTVPGPDAPESAREESATSSHRPAGRQRMTPGSAPPVGPVLRRFNGTLARRLEHPAVLPGGWELYGYESETGNPVYAGPGQELRIYA